MFGSLDPRRTRTPDIAAVTTGVTAFVGATVGGPTSPSILTSPADHSALFGEDTDDALARAVRDFFANGGERAIVVGVPSGQDGNSEAERYREALADVPSAMDFDLVCLPHCPGTSVAQGTLSAVLDVCVNRRAILLLDSPIDWSADPTTAIGRAANGIDELRRGLSESALRNAALYFPWYRTGDSNGQARVAQSSAAVAGIVARTDRERGVWAAPAGVQATIAGATDLVVLPTDAESTALNLTGVNVLRQFPNRGVVVWGARTLAGSASGDPEFRYLPVRRLALFIERSVDRGLAYATLEPNAEPLWQRVRTDVTHFMQRLFTSGALQGHTPTQAFYVRCGRDTMTEDDIDNGRLNVTIGIAPTRPAEFVILRIGHRLGDPDA